MGKLISLKEYAKMHNRTPVTVRKLVERGRLNATLVGRTYVIDSDTPCPEDARIKNGKYINWRNKNQDKEAKTET